MANEKGWINEDMMKEWIEKVWIRRKEAFFFAKSRSLYTTHSVHTLQITLKMKLKNILKSLSFLVA